MTDGPLRGGAANSGHIFRVGGTVRRPLAPCSPARHALLRHLETVGFAGAPRLLAVGHDCEVLSYVDGTAALDPLPDATLSDAALVSIAELLRRYHHAVATFDPADHRWPRPIPAAYRTRLVSHNDVHPANIVFRDGRAVALIDFDLAGPGSAIWDVATTARCWAPLRDESDVHDRRQGRALDRFRIFLDAYGLSRAERLHVADAVVDNYDWTHAIVLEAVAAGHPGFGVLAPGR